MENEEKQLLLQVLCAMLPYRPKFRNPHFIDVINTLVSIEPDYSEDITSGEVIVNSKYTLNEVKLYLRPMSSMTEEEKSWYEALRNALTYQENGEYDLDDFNELNDFLNRRKLDRYGLIEKNLALPATEGMYN